MSHDIFVSYRREGGLDFAGRLVDHLKNKGFNPFMDLEAMKSGRFDSQLYKKVDECEHFILVLSPGSLKRCKNEDDWVRKEVEYALKARKHIITIQMPGFSFPKNLPDKMELIRYVQAVLPSPDIFEHTVDRVVDYLKDQGWSTKDYDSVVSQSNDYIKRKNIIKAIVGVSAVLLVSLIVFLLTRYFIKNDTLDLQLIVKDENGEWSGIENISATVGDEVEYRILISNIPDDCSPVLFLEVDKSLQIQPESVIISGVGSEAGSSISNADLNEGINLRDYSYADNVYIDFMVRVKNYDLSILENSLYTKIRLVTDDKTINDYGIIQVSYLKGVFNNDDLVTGWGDSTGGRNVYTTSQVNDDYILGDTIAFNSITDWEPIGDERNYVAARKDTGINEGADNIWHGNEINVTEEGTYLVRMYVHNNNPNGEDAIAENVHAFISLPLKTGKTLGVYGYIESSNSYPDRYWDGVTFKSNKEFYLDYVEGSATMENNGIGANGGCPLRDSIITSEGVLLGYEKLNGLMPGGALYAAYISVKVKVVFVEENSLFTVESKIRHAGDKEWADEELSVEIGDEVEYQIHYKNSANTERSDVMVRFVPPSSVTYIEGSTVLYNSNHQDGLSLDESSSSINTGVNIGSYSVGGDAYIRGRYKVSGSEKLVSGRNILRFWGQVDDGTITLQDSSDLELNME